MRKLNWLKEYWPQLSALFFILSGLFYAYIVWFYALEPNDFFNQFIGGIRDLLDTIINSKKPLVQTTFYFFIIFFLMLIIIQTLVIWNLSIALKKEEFNSKISAALDLNSLSLISVEKVVEEEANAEEVWVFTPSLKIEMKHPLFEEAIGENLQQMVLHKLEQTTPKVIYKYFIPDSIEKQTIENFKEKYIKKIAKSHEKINESDAKNFLEKAIYKIPSDQVFPEILQEGMIYNPTKGRYGAKLFIFPFLDEEIPQMAYEVKDIVRKQRLIEWFEKNEESFRDFTTVEKDAESIYVTTFNLDLDVSGDMIPIVENNLLKEDEKKYKKDRENEFYDIKYKYIIFKTGDINQNIKLEQNLKTYEDEILRGKSISKEELFIEIDLGKINVPQEILKVFGAEFQERTIHIHQNNSTYSYNQVTDIIGMKTRTFSYKKSNGTGEKFVKKTVDAFKNLWDKGIYYNYRKVLCKNKSHQLEGLNNLKIIFFDQVEDFSIGDVDIISKIIKSRDKSKSNILNAANNYFSSSVLPQENKEDFKSLIYILKKYHY